MSVRPTAARPARAAAVRPWTALALAAAATAAAAATGCSPAGGQPAADGKASNAPPAAVRVDSSAPRADSGVVSVARAVTPAVVYIEVQTDARTAGRGQGQGQGQTPPGFEGIPRDLLPPGFNLPGQPQRRGPTRGSGSGVIVAANGYILTNNHVVDEADRVTVTLYDRRIFPARVIGRDPTTDIALIKIEATGLPTAALGDDRQVQVGQPVVAIGNPLGLRSTVTSGIISAKERSSLSELLGNQYAVADFLQTDAAINPGNSGGPLVDLAGRVIGINSAIQSPTGTYAGYGFAVPVGIARTAMEQFLRYGRVRRAILGVAIADVRPDDARAAGLSTITGALVQSVSEEGGARAAGLQAGDVITTVNGQAISSVAVLQRTIYGYQPGQTVTVGVQRYGAQRSIPVTLREAPAPRTTAAAAPARPAERAPASAPALGISIAPYTGGEATSARASELPAGTRGLAVRDVDPSGPAAGLLFRDDVITATLGAGGQRPIRSADDLATAVRAAPNGVVSLQVANGPTTRVVNIGVTR
jgi:serine protease Do